MFWVWLILVGAAVGVVVAAVLVTIIARMTTRPAV